MLDTTPCIYPDPVAGPALALIEDVTAKVVGISDGDTLTVLRGRQPAKDCHKGS